MPRPRKCRRVCRLPQTWNFAPLDCREKREAVILTVDEYEAIRLIDKQGLSQEECGAYMNIARTTVQQIYTIARAKLADMLVDGRPLRIEGGQYRLCEGLEEKLGCHGCCHVVEEARREAALRSGSEGGTSMKIAIPVDDTKKAVCVSFGRAPYMLFKDLNSGAEELLENPAAEAQGGAGLKAAQFLVDNEADGLITIRCGENAAEVLQVAEMKIYEADKTLDAAANLAACAEGKLPELTHFHAGYHGIR